jgi:hypothetical protein
MISLRDPRRYRLEAAQFREMAAAVGNTPALRDSYLALSIQYERLAQILEKSDIAIVGDAEASAMIA